MTITNTVLTGAESAGTTTTPDFTSTSGSLIVVVGSWFGSSTDPVAGTGSSGSITDNKTNPYTLAGFIRNGSNEGVAVWYNLAGTRGASHHVIMLVGSAGSNNLGVAEFTTNNTWNSPPFDSGTFATGTDSTDPIGITAAGAISGTAVAFFGSCIDNGANGTWTPSTGYSNIFNFGNGSIGLTSDSSYKIGETGTPTLSVGYSAAISSARNLFATFSEAGGGGAFDPPDLQMPIRQLNVYRM